MKLVNPTDDELNVAFAEKVAGAVPCDQWKPFMHDSMMKGDCGHEACYPRKLPVDYCKSANAVLPWLEKTGFGNTPWIPSPKISHLSASVIASNLGWRVDVGDDSAHTDKSFAKAATIALLRVHGVEIEFT